MLWLSSEPQSWAQRAGVIVLEGEAGGARDGVVARWLHQRESRSGPTWWLQCRSQEGGAWAGLNRLVEDLVPRLRDRAPELLSRHGRELSMVLPGLTPELSFPQSLADTAPDDDRARNYAADRAYRSLHGLVELLSEWHELTCPGPWSVVCDGYDDASALLRRFFAELVRRRGEQLQLQLLVVTGPGRGAAVAAEFEPSVIVAAGALALPRSDAAVPSPAAMRRLAVELEGRLADDPALRETQLPPLIEAWRRSDDPQRATRWRVEAMAHYNLAGLYEAALPYADAVEGALDVVYAEDRELYAAAVRELHLCKIMLGRAASVVPIIEQALARAATPAEVASNCYELAVLHVRYLEHKDNVKGEELLLRGRAALDGADITAAERETIELTIMRGLALVRLRDGDVQESLAICRSAIARFDQHLDRERNRLHGSVLRNVTAQVHAHVGPYEDAIAYFSQAIEMDPNYSEYYNDRGTVYFKMQRLPDAERDYLRAIELSPPYAEVWTNLGQCYRAMGRMDDAMRAYSRALDLNPAASVAVAGRAEARYALELDELALEDYDRALVLAPEQPLVLAGRAILLYEARRLPDALADLDAAVALAPDIADLYQNRAVALGELGHRDEAARDLTTYLQLSPEAEDRGDVEESLSLLKAARS
jgi:tetratricopeptide (TPR) repeat protein